MTDAADRNESLGTIRRLADGTLEARLERLLAHDQTTVWAMLTERVAQWLAPGQIELVRGGRARLDFEDSGTVIDSAVTALEPPRLLEYSWSSGDEPERPVRWETEAVPEGTRLALTLRVPADEDVARACAGWEAHLQMLLAAIEGVPIKFPFERFKETREQYRLMVDRLPT
jgi:uncharacterized protein YndB with AHSA1/START domain